MWLLPADPLMMRVAVAWVRASIGRTDINWLPIPWTLSTFFHAFFPHADVRKAGGVGVDFYGRPTRIKLEARPRCCCSVDCRSNRRLVLAAAAAARLPAAEG